MSQINALKEMIRDSPVFQVENVWIKLAVSAVVASLLKSRVDIPSITALWFVFVVLCWTQKFAGLQAVAHWFSRYVGLFFSLFLVPQILVHLFRRELIIGLAILSYFYPNLLATDAVIFVSSFCLLGVIEGFKPKVFSVIVMALMLVVPIGSVLFLMQTQPTLWTYLGVAIGNVTFFLLGRVSLWSYKIRWQPKDSLRDAVLPKERRLS